MRTGMITATVATIAVVLDEPLEGEDVVVGAGRLVSE
jgi:hypothetical protein